MNKYLNEIKLNKIKLSNNTKIKLRGKTFNNKQNIQSNKILRILVR